jgi:serine/threonine protein kinase
VVVVVVVVVKVTLKSSNKASNTYQSIVGTPDYLSPEILLGVGHGAHLLYI